jgi:hypothetical protein
MSDEQQFRNRQAYADMDEIKRIAVECVERGNKHRRTWKRDDVEINLFAQMLIVHWLECAEQKNPLRPLGPALAFARQADREKLTDRTAMRYQWHTVAEPAPNPNNPFTKKGD